MLDNARDAYLSASRSGKRWFWTEATAYTLAVLVAFTTAWNIAAAHGPLAVIAAAATTAVLLLGLAAHNRATRDMARAAAALDLLYELICHDDEPGPADGTYVTDIDW